MLLPPWALDFPHCLGVCGEKSFLQPIGLSVRDYSTASFLSQNPSAERPCLGLVSLSDSAEPAVVESFDATLEKYCEKRGLRPTLAADADLLCQQIETAANNVVGMVPCCRASVTELVRSIHPIASAGEDYDTSHSDPAIPFSIFVSVPTSPERRSLLRLAESLVHEAMHLQLSLFEAMCPLVDGTVQWEMHSPWKQTKRQTQGVMHGMYVFCVLKWMWEQVGQASDLPEDHVFAARRIKDIAHEINGVSAIVRSPALTSEGRIFVQSVLRA